MFGHYVRPCDAGVGDKVSHGHACGGRSDVERLGNEGDLILGRFVRAFRLNQLPIGKIERGELLLDIYACCPEDSCWPGAIYKGGLESSCLSRK